MNLKLTSDARCNTLLNLGSRVAFSLIEIIVVVGLMSFIILGLMQMFNQTQRAYKLGTTQVDVLEGGRAVIEMMQRELSQMKASRASNTLNFYAQIALAGGYKPLLQELPGIPNPPGSPLPNRTNILQEIFFLTEENQRWVGNGYFVSSPAEGVGTLYRCEYRSNYGDDPRLLFIRFDNDLSGFHGAGTVKTNMTRLLDGAVHLRVRAYNTNGVWLTNSFSKVTNSVTGAVFTYGIVVSPYSTVYPPAVAEVESYSFYSNVVPASVDMELGILEDAAIAKIKALYNPNAAAQATARRNYLTNQAARTHLFRIRVPIRNVDPTAYQ